MNSTFQNYLLYIFVASFVVYRTYRFIQSKLAASATRKFHAVSAEAEERRALTEALRSIVDYRSKGDVFTAASMEALTEAIGSLADNDSKVDAEISTAMSELTKALQGQEYAAIIEKQLNGVMRCCEALVKATDDHRKSVSKFTDVISAKPQYDPEPIIHPPTDDDANKVARTMELILQGMSVSDANNQAEAEEEKKTMMSAASMDYSLE